jgi:predicted RNA polymerase sigma factor
LRDVGLAEDLAQDALVAALEQWPESGVREKPGAWLMAAAKHRAIDHSLIQKLSRNDAWPTRAPRADVNVPKAAFTCWPFAGLN